MEPILKRETGGGEQEVYRFDNRYGASVIREGIFSYGGLELAVIEFFGEGEDDWKLCYTTPITDDVMDTCLKMSCSSF